MRYHIKTEDKEIVLEFDGNQYLIDNIPVVPDIVKTSDNQFHLILNDKSFYAEIHNVDPITKSISIKVNGNRYELSVADRYDRLLRELGIETTSQTAIKEIKAPMPGLVIDVMVQEGQEITENDPLILLEAMKMENIIKSPRDGKIAHIKISAGDAVEKNQAMILFE